MIYTNFAKKCLRRIIIAVSALGVASTAAIVSSGCAATAFSQSAATAAVNCQGPGTIPAASCTTPEGSWLYTVTIPNTGAAATVFQGVETYAGSGGYSEADELSILPGYLATAGHGGWSTSTGSGFLLTYQNLTYDASGNPTGTSKVRQTATMDSTSTMYSGSGDFTYYDLTGATVASGTFTITAKRIVVEAPAAS